MRQFSVVGLAAAINKIMIVIDQANCIGCGLCASLCPDNFRINDDFKAEVVNSAQPKPCSQEAINNCPVQVISQE